MPRADHFRFRQVSVFGAELFSWRPPQIPDRPGIPAPFRLGQRLTDRGGLGGLSGADVIASLLAESERLSVGSVKGRWASCARC